MIPGLLACRSQPKLYGTHLVTVCCGKDTKCFIGSSRGTLSCTIASIALAGIGILSYPAMCIHPVVEIIAGTLYVALVISYALTSFTNPGILPKQSLDEFEKEKQHHIESGKDLSRLSSCNKCNIFRPSFAYHCHSCNACIENLDHHCPFTGHCIGKNNFVYFRIFIILLQCTILAFLAIIFVFAAHSAGNCHMHF